MTCDRCDRSLTDQETGTSIFGCRIERPVSVEGDAGAFQRLYPELPPSFTVNLCSVCWLAALGLTPDKVNSIP